MHIVARTIPLLLPAIVAACAPPQSQSNQTADAQERELNALRYQLNQSEARIREQDAALNKLRAAAPELSPQAAETAEEPDLCWQDYCPCDPPQGGADAGICRQLRAGIHVDDDMMAAAAMGRDARRQLDEFEAKYGPM